MFSLSAVPPSISGPTKEDEIETLKIPAKYVPWMRFAALAELEDAGRGLKDESESAAQEVRRSELGTRHDFGQQKPIDLILSDVIGMARSAPETIQVALGVLEGTPEKVEGWEEQMLVVEGPPEALAHLLDSLYRRILSAELSNWTARLQRMTPER